MRPESDKLSQNVPVSQGHKEDVRLRSVRPPVWQQQLLRTFVAGSTKQIFDAGAFCLEIIIWGLVCDPLGGLVEVPCIKRNVIGSVNAITASDMAMAGIESKVPLDEVIDAMAEVGDLLPCSLKETSQAGLAQTETGKKYMPES